MDYTRISKLGEKEALTLSKEHIVYGVERNVEPWNPEPWFHEKGVKKVRGDYYHLLDEEGKKDTWSTNGYIWIHKEKRKMDTKDSLVGKKIKVCAEG